MWAPREGGAAVLLAVVTDAFNVSVSGNIVLTDTEIVLTDSGSAEGQGRIVAVAKAGGATRVIAQSQGRPWGLTRDASNLYWSTVDFPSPGSSVGALRAVPIQGGTATTLLTTTSAGYFSFAVAQSGVYFGQENDAPYFGGTPAANLVGVVGKDGAGLTHLLDDIVHCCMLVRDNELLWISFGPPRVVRSLDMVFKSTAVVRGMDDCVFWMAADSAGVFVISSGCDPLPPDSTIPPNCAAWLRNLLTNEDLAYANQPAYVGLTIDENYAYWMIGAEDLYRVRR
jgi:hypothetical protein